MGLLLQQHINGVPVRITRPAKARQADGSTVRVGTRDGIDPEPRVLQLSVKLRLKQLTDERRAIVFGATSRASCTIRVPFEWQLAEGDQIEGLGEPVLGDRFRVEKVVAYNERPRIRHVECALVSLPRGTP